jgi:hypothetical protein
MADRLNNFPPGTVTHIYMTSDGGATLQDFFDLVPLLQVWAPCSPLHTSVNREDRRVDAVPVTNVCVCLCVLVCVRVCASVCASVYHPPHSASQEHVRVVAPDALVDLALQSVSHR